MPRQPQAAEREEEGGVVESGGALPSAILPVSLHGGQKPFLPRLESLRGLAALSVAIFHINLTTWVQDGVTHPIKTCAQADFACFVGKVWWNINGISAVLLFFVISGYVLTVSMQRRSSGWADAPRFAALRALRLYPAVILMIGLFATYQFTTGLSMYEGTYSLKDVIEQSLLISTHINPVTYTLQLELIGSALLFIAFHADRRFGGWIAFGLFVVFSALSFYPKFGKLITPYGGPQLIFLSAFMAGMLSVLISSTVILKLPVLAQRIILVAASMLFFITKPLISSSSGWGVLIESLTAAIIVGILAHGQTGRLLDVAPLRLLGRVSYSFYLLHPMSWYFIIAHIDQFRMIVPGPDIVVSMACCLASVALTAPIAWLSYRLVELPAMRAGRILIDGVAPKTSTQMQ